MIIKRYFIISLLALLSVSSSNAAETLVVADSIQQISEVVVTGTRNATDIRHLPLTVTIVDRNKLTENNRQSILPTLTEQIPGLLATSRGVMGYGVSGGASGGMMLRGISSSAGQIMVLIDGHPQYNGIYGHSIADSYQTMMAERVEVLRGPASMLYGSNAMGGVVNIVTRGMQHDGCHTMFNIGAGSYGTIQAEGSNRYRSGKFSSTVAAQYGRSDNHRPNMGFEQFGGYVKLGYDISNFWNVYADLDITHFNASYPGTVDSPMLEADQWITRGAAAIGIENHYSRTSGRLSVYDNFGRHKINDGYYPTSSSNNTPKERYFRSSDALMGVSWFQTANLWKNSRLTLGFDYQDIYGHTWYTNRKTGEEEENGVKQSADVHNKETAVYLDIRQDFLSWLTLDAGIRYDYHTVTGNEWIPQAGLVIRPVNNGEIRLMASKGFRNPTMKEMYLYPPSNEDLKPERMWNYELSWHQQLMEGRFKYGFNAFKINADNIIQTVNRKNINTGEIHNYGLEGEAEWQINEHWSVNTNHSWLHMDNPVVSAPQYKGYIGCNLRYGKFIANTGIMQVVGLYTAVGNNENKENFTIVNATVGYNMYKGLQLWLRGDNLLAQRYEYIIGMPMPKATFMAGFNLEF